MKIPVAILSSFILLVACVDEEQITWRLGTDTALLAPTSGAWYIGPFGDSVRFSITAQTEDLIAYNDLEQYERMTTRLDADTAGWGFRQVLRGTNTVTSGGRIDSLTWQFYEPVHITARAYTLNSQIYLINGIFRDTVVFQPATGDTVITAPTEIFGVVEIADLTGSNAFYWNATGIRAFTTGSGEHYIHEDEIDI